MDIAVADKIRALLAMLRRRDEAKSSGLLAAVVRMHRIQTWFQHHRGAAMLRAGCRACGTDRLFTIWIDGKYHCLACFYEQVAAGRGGPVPMRVAESAMHAFADDWRAYRIRIESIEDPWEPPIDLTAALARSSVGPLLPPSICTIGRCDACDAMRPFMRREDGDAGCIHCLMRGRIVEIPYEIAAEAAA